MTNDALQLGDVVKVKETEQLGGIVQVMPNKLYYLDSDFFRPYTREELEPTLLTMEDVRSFYARREGVGG